jgi:hypothetical protein
MCLAPEVADGRYWWAREVSNALGDNGFDDVKEAWWKWQG